jgi:hypothetical protein
MPKPTFLLANATCHRFAGRLTWPLVLQLVLAALILLALAGMVAWGLTPLLIHWLRTYP